MTTQPHMKTVDEIVEKIEVIINRHSPMENFEVKEQCAREIAEQIVHQQRKEILEAAIERIEEEMQGDSRPIKHLDWAILSDPDQKLGFDVACKNIITILQTLQKEV